MPITLDDLTVNFAHLDRERLLEDWRWLIGPLKQPILLSAIGDAFVQDAADGTVHLLETAEGTCDQVAADVDEFRAMLADRQWVMDFLAASAIADFLGNGVNLQPGQIYSWKRPPILGGGCEPANVEPTDIAVHFSILGQLHRQIRDLPPGTPITEIRWG